MGPVPINSKQQASPTREQLVDEFGELDRQVKAFQPKADRHEELGKLIRSWYAELAADEGTIAKGHLYMVRVGKKAHERKFSLAAKLVIFARLGKKRALELFSITLKAVAAEPKLGKAAIDELAVKTQTGSRKLVPVLMEPAGAIAA